MRIVRVGNREHAAGVVWYGGGAATPLKEE